MVNTARVVAEEHVGTPLLVGAGSRVERAGDVRLARGVELFFGAQLAAVGTENMQHDGVSG
ncbi:hypothetical protein D1872_337260 [compost metagenome]